jgi:hypothetical protein
LVAFKKTKKIMEIKAGLEIKSKTVWAVDCETPDFLLISGNAAQEKEKNKKKKCCCLLVFHGLQPIQ